MCSIFFKSTTLFLLLNLLFSLFSIAQTEPGSGEAKNSKKAVPEQIENSGKLRYKLLSEQNRENSMTMNAIDVNELRFVHFAEKDFFYFEKKMIHTNQGHTMYLKFRMIRRSSGEKPCPTQP